jgi:hypothetical protein
LAVPDRSLFLPIDLETTPLEIKTDSTLGSKDMVGMRLYNSRDVHAGGFYLRFTTPPQYYVWYCNTTYTNFPTKIPAATDKIWRITLNRTSGIRLIIQCNEEEVLNFLPSDSTCSEKSWNAHWNLNIKKIEFDSKDTASDFYRPTSKINIEIIS